MQEERGPGSLTARRKLETRQEIAGAALALFLRDGFDSVGAEEIAAQAGVSLRTFYRYFPSKDEVLAPIVAAGTAQLSRAIAARPSTESLVVAVHGAYEQISSAVGPDSVHSLIALLVGVPALRARWLDALRDIEESLVPVIVQRCAELSQDEARLSAAAIVAALRLTLERSARIGSSDPLADAFGAALRYLGGGAHLSAPTTAHSDEHHLDLAPR